ncbi:GntR family transcriptional regulator [Maribacter hydrothermalis]|uniref:GntR family transcriptional regulator n=1 Tax=Maribacter hydrothermalis TaxID=1836467 RepID=A0A1B7ZEQ2_9FLAO|nr:GntR family transcriptional regulator [Maribacter hydrothermalis]APQ17553.1 GntR family transcriptional regulator [Maribacter hydrothermalis]OBR42028.1 GntR family transcriptional regulator [Maribacter hydrothermalis]
MPVVKKVLSLKQYNSLSKHEQLVQGVIESIEEGKLTIGDQLPSINNMVDEIGYARKTIFKAYEELKNRGLIESRQLKGYFIISQETNITKRMALLLFAFQSYQEEFYKTFRKEMGKRFQIDVFFHHNNLTIFETILTNINGKYGMYIIAPIQDPSVVPMLQSIEPKKLLLVDRYLDLGKPFSYIAQEFENVIYNSLVKLLPEIRKYNKIILFFNEESDYSPISIKHAYERFLKEYAINGTVKKNYSLGAADKGNLYFILGDTILWQVLRDCVRKKYKIGEDIGILSQNDNVAKEIVFGGITTISTDFIEMAKMAAEHLKKEKTTQVIMPSRLIKRNSL